MILWGCVDDANPNTSALNIPHVCWDDQINMDMNCRTNIIYVWVRFYFFYFFYLFYLFFFHFFFIRHKCAIAVNTSKFCQCKQNTRNHQSNKKKQFFLGNWW